MVSRISLIWVDRYISFRNWFYKGMSELTAFRQLLQASLLIGAFLAILGLPKAQTIWLVVILTIVGVFFFTLFGWWWDKMGFWRIEIEWNNKRNQFVDDVRKRLKTSRRSL